MINLKRLLTNVLNTLNGKVSKTGDTMSGNLDVVKAGNSRVKVASTQNSTTVANGGLQSTTDGDFGVYDDVHSRWLARTDSNGQLHVPTTLTVLNTTKVYCTAVGTSYRYTTIPALANWNVVAVRFTVHEQSQLLFFVRGEGYERSLTDWPAAGKFRGGIYIDWNNNRIGIRCLSGGSQGNLAHLVFFDIVYGVL